MTNSFAQLKQAQAKFKACLENVKEVKPENKSTFKICYYFPTDYQYASDKTILVPLTNSLYVPGKLSDLEHVIVDVGTGYYVKKVRIYEMPFNALTNTIHCQTRPQAVKHYTDKVEYIRKNVDSLEDTIQKKRDNMNYLTSILQQKIQAETQSGPSARAQ